MHSDIVAEIQQRYAPEEDALASARAAAPASARPPSPEIGALLRWVAVTGRATAAVEVGSAAGISGLWLLAGLGHQGLLTSIEPDPHGHGLATHAYADAGVEGRVRAILSDPLAVLPRLSDGAYDLMLLQSDPTGYVAGLEHARRLLRPGGMLVVRGVLRSGDHAQSLAAFLDELADDPSMTATVLPLDEGVALATRIAPPEDPTTS